MRWMTLVVVVALPAVAGAESRAVCVQSCAARIAECASACGTFGALDKACKKEVIKRCKREGVGTCLPPTTTTTLALGGTTSTTTGGGISTTTTTMPLSLCDQYCNLVLANCTGGNEVYNNQNACQNACSGFAPTGQTGDQSGDTVQCRITHAQLAGGAPGTHCPHTEAQSSTCN